MMAVSLTEVLEKFKREWLSALAPEAIESVCKNLDYAYRKRKLCPVVTIQLFLLQILNGNTALTHIRHLGKISISAAAFCKARMRIPLKVLEGVLASIQDSLHLEDYNKNTWCGHRVFLADGTGVSMSDVKELKEEFGYPGRQRKECSFPVAKLLAMVNLGSGMITKVIVDPLRTHDMSQAPSLCPELKEGDILVSDRALCAYHYFCLLLKHKLHAVIRMHQKLIADFTPGRGYVAPGEVPSDLGQPKNRQVILLGKKDQIIEWFKSVTKPKSFSKEEYKALPASITVRQLQYQVQQKGFRTRKITIMTTLTDAKKYSAKKIAELYGLRWQIELDFNHLKTTMKMDILKSKTVEGIKKELIAFFIVYNLVRLVMLEAAKRQKVKLKRISFIDALRWLLEADSTTELYALILNPDRPGRYEPRTKKRREKPYPYMIRPREELRKKKLSEISQYDQQDGA